MLNLVETAKGDLPHGPAAEVSEPDRLAALKRYEILDTPPEAAFDDITALAAELFKVPIALIGFHDGNRLWFKSSHGLALAQISWPLDLTGAAPDQRLRREFNPSFFANAPLRTADGFDLGTLCVIDRQPRLTQFSPTPRLEALARLVVDQLELRLTRIKTGRNALMASEIDHRIMNSLQLVASLLHLQSRTAGQEAARELTTAAARVLAVARVHRSFAAHESASRVDVLANLRRLCGELSDIMSTTVKVDGREASVPASQILPISMVVNELVTNAKKHGDGAICVTFGGGDRQHELRVFDRGKGLPEDFFAGGGSRRGIGMRVIGALVDQLAGKITAGVGPDGIGACFTITFPAI
jgi:two-component sensor histidine kinase